MVGPPSSQLRSTFTPGQLGDVPALSDEHTCAAGRVHSRFRGLWPEVLIKLNKCFGAINVFHLEKVNDLDQFVSFNSLPPLVSVMKL